jgi:Peptidase A4 family
MRNSRGPRQVAVLVSSFFVMVAAARAQQSPAPSPKHGVIQLLRNSDGTVRRVSEQSVSTNWSGYAVANYQTNITYTSASFNWTVPAVTYSSTGGTGIQSSAIWVGIGGDCADASCTRVDPTLIQLGSEQDALSDGKAVYYVWYELLPAFGTFIAETVEPGDQMTASLACTANCEAYQAQTWSLSMADLTRDWTFSTTVPYHSSLFSAEWIVEAPTGFGGVLPLANFGTATLTAAMANGLNPGLVAADGIYIQDSHGETGSVSIPALGDAFNVCWASGSTFASCPAPN